MVELKDIIRCPTCGGAEIIYSCEPKCCFNHVCADCRTSFQIVTQKTGRFDREREIAPVEPASGDPTTACAACDCLKLALIQEGPPPLLLCGNCRAVLELAIEEVAPA